MSEVVETNKSGLWLGLMIGGAVGAITSLLIAPKAGNKLREDLMNTYRTWQEKTKEIATSVSEGSKAIAESVSQKTEDLVDTAKETAKESQHRVTDTIQAAKTTFQNN